MAVSLAISEIFIVKEWCDLEMWVWGCSRSLKRAFGYGSDVLNRIESNRKNRFVSENRIGMCFFLIVTTSVSVVDFDQRHIYNDQIWHKSKS